MSTSSFQILISDLYAFQAFSSSLNKAFFLPLALFVLWIFSYAQFYIAHVEAVLIFEL